MEIKCNEIKERFSCRSYDGDKPVSDEAVRCILNAGAAAPSGKNLQPWRFRVIDSRKVVEAIADALPNNKWCKSANKMIAVFMEADNGYDIMKNSMAVGACIENILLEAVNHEISACWIGECTEHENEIKELLRLETTLKLMAMITLGYCRRKLNQPEKKSLKLLLI